MEIGARELQDEGRIPFRVRIGVTGHRVLEGEESLAPIVREQVRRVLNLLSADSTTISLTAVSQLADGADRLVVREVMSVSRERGQEANIECFLPLPREEYIRVQEFDHESEREFESLLEKATVIQEPSGGGTGSRSSSVYRVAGHLLVGRSDVLIALWDGLPSRGRGGTAETLLYAAARSQPCIWIEAGGDYAVHHNLDPGEARAFFNKVENRAGTGLSIPWSPMDHPAETMEALCTSLRSLDQFNGESLPSSFRSLVQREQETEGLAEWVAAPFARATTLASRWRRRFDWAARLIPFLAWMGAVMLGIGLSYGHEAEFWAWAEAAMFTAAIAGLILVRRVEFHRRWLSFRVLAERLRCAHFLAPAGADFRRQARLEAVYSGNESTVWLMRAFEEVWDRRPQPVDPTTLPVEDQQRLKQWLADDWVGNQIAYHEGVVRKNRRWHRIQTAAVGVLFVGTIVFAVLHALHTLEHAPVLFSIVLPAAVAALGVLMTVNQRHAIAERSARMRSDLAVVRRDILDAPPHELDTISSEAARIIAQENGAWFGSMWFLDIEHP